MVVTTSSRPPRAGLSWVKTAGTSSEVDPLDLVEREALVVVPMLTFAVPTVSARSERIGPKLLVERVKRPSPGSSV